MKFYCLTLRNLKEIYRDPVSLLLGIVMPAALLLLFSTIYNNTGVELFSPQKLTPGMIVFSFAFLMMFSSVLLAKDRQSAFLIRLYTTPLKPSDFMLAYMLAFVPLAIAQVVVCFVVGVILGATFSGILLSLLIFLLIAVICISLGTIMGALFTVNQVSGIGAIVITVISIFSGAWTPLKEIGGVFETIGYALPFAHAVDATQGLLTGSSFEAILNNLYPILIYTGVLIFLAIVSFRLAMKKV